jgi:hypothetical protein
VCCRQTQQCNVSLSLPSHHQAKKTRANILLRASKTHGLKVWASSACSNEQRATPTTCRGLATVLVTGGLDFRGQKGMLESSEHKKLKLKLPHTLQHTHSDLTELTMAQHARRDQGGADVYMPAPELIQTTIRARQMSMFGQKLVHRLSVSLLPAPGEAIVCLRSWECVCVCSGKKKIKVNFGGPLISPPPTGVLGGGNASLLAASA